MDWITDRLPTEADADPYGDVVVALKPDGWEMTDWSDVPESRPWLPFIPPAASVPEPATPATPIASQRRIVSITRTVQASGDHTIDAVADDGTAWWMATGVTDGWIQLPALPDRG